MIPDAAGMNRTRAQRRYRKKGYTHEIAYLKEPFPTRYFKGLIYLVSPQRHKTHRPYLLPGEVIRPVAVSYIHNGGKP